MDEWDWRRQIEVNLTGAFFCTQLLGRVMADEGGGGIINIAPLSAFESRVNARVAYVTAKAGLLALTRQAADELAEYGIRVNAVAGDDRDAVVEAALNLCSDVAFDMSGRIIKVDDAGHGASFAG